MPMTSPSKAETVASPDDQMMKVLHCGPCLRSEVKYTEWGIGPRYAWMRDAVVVDCTTSPDACEMYTCSPLGQENFQSGRIVRRGPSSVHWSGSSIEVATASFASRPVHAAAVRRIISGEASR